MIKSLRLPLDCLSYAFSSAQCNIFIYVFERQREMYLASLAFQAPPARIKDDLCFCVYLVCALVELLAGKLLSLLLLLRQLRVKKALLGLQVSG